LKYIDIERRASKTLSEEKRRVDELYKLLNKNKWYIKTIKGDVKASLERLEKDGWYKARMWKCVLRRYLR
jgi:predicted RNA binding protein YcfA (HicA-like mRNA interferase family)